MNNFRRRRVGEDTQEEITSIYRYNATVSNVVVNPVLSGRSGEMNLDFGSGVSVTFDCTITSITFNTSNNSKVTWTGNKTLTGLQLTSGNTSNTFRFYMDVYYVKRAPNEYTPSIKRVIQINSPLDDTSVINIDVNAGLYTFGSRSLQKVNSQSMTMMRVFPKLSYNGNSTYNSGPNVSGGSIGTLVVTKESDGGSEKFYYTTS